MEPYNMTAEFEQKRNDEAMGKVAMAGEAKAYQPFVDWGGAIKAIETVYNLILPYPRNLIDWVRHLVEQNKSLLESLQKLEADKGVDYKRGYVDGRRELIDQINRAGTHGRL